VGQRSMKVYEDQEFMASNRWKCSQSPCGAHYWIVCNSQMTCKYCESIRPMDSKRYGWTKPDEK
jgi:hypothetical protein